MGKRSHFRRVEKDFYETWDERAVKPLLPFLKPVTRFAEPCYGGGALAKQLIDAGHNVYWKSDLSDGIDALTLTTPLQQADCVITNPPWTRSILHPMIEHFRKQNVTWLLFDADWMHTKQAIPYMPYCEMVVSVGRLKWIRDSKHDSKDNCCWYKFVADKTQTRFVARNV